MSHDNEGHETTPVKTESTGEVTKPASKDGSHESQGGQAKPVSPQKLAANRANAEHSTGPKTPKGRKRANRTAANTASLLACLSRPGRKVTSCSSNIVI